MVIAADAQVGNQCRLWRLSPARVHESFAYHLNSSIGHFVQVLINSANSLVCHLACGATECNYLKECNEDSCKDELSTGLPKCDFFTLDYF